MDFLAKRVHMRAFGPAVPLLEEGQDAPGLYVIRSGLVAVVVQNDAGSDRELARLGKGDCVGEMALMTGEPCSATVRTVTDTETWFIERGDFVDLVDHCPGLWRNLGRILSRRLVRTSRHLAAESSTSPVALAMACPEEEAAALAIAIGASLARQTGGRTLLVDARGGSVRPASDLAPGHAVPSVWNVVHERSLLVEHEAALEQADGLSGVRIAGLGNEDGHPPTDEESVTALEWLRPLYDHILLLLPRPPREESSALLDRARSIVAVVAEEEVTAMLPWLDRVCRSSDRRGKVEVAIMSARRPTSSVKHAIEERVGRPVRRLPVDASLLQKMFREKVPLTEAHPESPMSRAVGRLARHIGQIEVGLALGAGAAKGFAHVGVLRVFEENRVPIDYIAGCSIGAIVGALYSGGFSLAAIQAQLEGADRKVSRWTLPLRAIWSDSGLRELLRGPAPTVQFQDLSIPFAAVATDLATGREVVLQHGVVWRAVQASVSIPGIFPPTVIGDRYLVDGGLVSPVPTQTVREMGADIVVAVDLMSLAAGAEAPGDPRRGWGTGPARRAPNLVEMMWRSTEIMQGEITSHSAATADVTIQPQVGRSRWSDFSNRGRSFVAAGEEAAKEALPELRSLLPFLSQSPDGGGASQ